MVFDLRTIYAMTAIACLVLGLIQGAAYFTGRFERWLGWWSASNILIGIGSLSIAFKGIGPSFITTEFGNGTTIAGCVLLPAAMRAFRTRRVDLFGCILIIVILNLPLLLVLRGPDAWADRLTLTSSMFCILDLAVALQAYRLWKDERLTSPIFAFLLFLITASLYASRAVMSSLGLLGEAGLFQQGNQLHAGLALSALVFITLRSMVIMLMAMERATVQLREAAFHDPLTGVLNRAGLARLFCACAAKPLAVLVVDLDHFKQLNDNGGHALGDRVLQIFAEAARSTVGEQDLVARHGGDEFVLVLQDRTIGQAVNVAENLRVAFSLLACGIDAPLPIRPTLSIGVTAREAGLVELEALLQQADQALYRRKRDGRDGVDAYTPALAA